MSDILQFVKKGKFFWIASFLVAAFLHIPVLYLSKQCFIITILVINLSIPLLYWGAAIIWGIIGIKRKIPFKKSILNIACFILMTLFAMGAGLFVQKLIYPKDIENISCPTDSKNETKLQNNSLTN